DTNLWVIQVDARGKLIGQPRRITNWSGSGQCFPHTSADGKRLAVMKVTGHSSIYVGELEANGTRLKAPHPLTLSEDNHSAAAWTLDGRAIVFASDRNGRWEIFKQRLDEDQPELLASDAESNLFNSHVSPDG